MPTPPKGKTTATEPDEFDFADAWRPEPGDVLRGKVTNLDMGHSEFGAYPIITVQSGAPDDDSEYAVHAFHQALRDKLRDLKPSIGSEIAIKFFGEQKSTTSKFTYAKYGVKVEGGRQEFWGDVPRAAPEPEAEKDTDEDIPF